MLKLKFHINQPDVTYKPRPGVVIARHPPVIDADVGDDELGELGRLVETYPPAGTVGLAPGEAPVLRQKLSLVRVGKPLFRTALHDGIRTMIINDTRGLEDYRQFPKRFNTQFSGVQPAPGLDAIGCGYDIFGTYAEKSSLKRRLFDVGKMLPLRQTQIGNNVYNHWPIVTIHALSSSGCKTIVGETAIAYSKKLSESVGLEAGFLGFHGQTESDFTTSTTRNMYYAFTNVIDTTPLFSIHLDDRDDLRNYLTNEALNAIDNTDGKWSPDRLFDEFGLYFLTGIVIGGRLTYWSYVDTFYLASTTDLKVMAEAGFLNAIGVTTTIHSSTTFTTYQRWSEAQIATIGGDATKGGRSIVDQTSYQRWKDSIADYPDFIDFTIPTTKRPLTPIWSLATGARRAELEARAPEYAANVIRQFESEHAIDPTRRAATYIVTTHTGSGDGAGTDADIWIVLYGVDRLGNVRQTPRLKHDDSRDNHNKYAVDAIEFGGLLDVGELTRMKVTHVPRGDRGAWQLEKVEVLCLENQKLYKAYYNGWLDNGSVTLNLYL